MNKSMIRFLLLLLKLCFFALAVYWLFKDLDFDYVVMIFSRINYGYLMGAVICVALILLLQAVKWGIILPSLQFKERLRVTLVGHTISYMIGGQIAGDASKVFVIGEKTVSKTLVTASIIADKVLSLVGIFIVGMIGALLSKDLLDNHLALIILVTSVLGTLSIFLLCRRKNAIFQKNGESEDKTIVGKIKSVLFDIVDSFYKCTISKTKVALSVICGVFLQILSVMTICFVFLSLETNVNIAFLCAVSEIQSVSGLIPLSLAGIGIPQITELSLFQSYGLASEQISAQITIKYLIMVGYAVIGGIVLLATKSNKLENHKIQV